MNFNVGRLFDSSGESLTDLQLPPSAYSKSALSRPTPCPEASAVSFVRPAIRLIAWAYARAVELLDSPRILVQQATSRKKPDYRQVSIHRGIQGNRAPKLENPMPDPIKSFASLVVLSASIAGCGGGGDVAGSSPVVGHGEPITYTDCWTDALVNADARCGLLQVPADYSDASGPTRQTAFTIVPPLAGADEIAREPVIYLIGGPGLSGTYLSEIDGYSIDDLEFLRRARSVILVDYRGIGRSEPFIDCEFSRTMEECRSALRTTGLGPELRTAIFAKDIDSLLEALDFKSVVLYGESYGTRVALTMMRDVPNRISHVVLDSVFPPEVGMHHDPQSALAGLSRIADVCDANDECTEAFGDLRSKIMDLGERWSDREDAGTLLGGLATTAFFPSAPLLVDTLWKLEAGEAAKLADRLAQVTNEQHFEDSAEDRAESNLMAMGVICSEEAHLLEQHAPFDTSRYGITGTTLQTILSTLYGAPMPAQAAVQLCQAFDIPAAPDREVLSVESDIRALILSGGMDQDTSFEWGELTKSRLTNSRHFIFPFTGHVSATNNECAAQIAAQFVVDPERELDTSCHSAELARSSALVFESSDIWASIEAELR